MISEKNKFDRGKMIQGIEEVQKIQFDMLCYMDEIARKHHIKVMLAGGTLLGAVRHQGFIPWDDDVDVLVLRKDYKRLLKCIHSDKGSHYRIMTASNTLSYPLPFAKLIDARTVLDEQNDMKTKGMGISADIFPVDTLPADRRLRSWIMRMVSKKASEVYSLRDTNYNNTMKKLEYWTRLCQIKIKLLQIYLLCNGFPVFNARYMAAIVGIYGEKEIMKKSDMAYCTKVLFNGRRFYAPAGYKKYLSNLYGKDYMQLPPKSKQRTPHHMNIYWR